MQNVIHGSSKLAKVIWFTCALIRAGLYNSFYSWIQTCLMLFYVLILFNNRKGQGPEFKKKTQLLSALGLKLG